MHLSSHACSSRKAIIIIKRQIKSHPRLKDSKKFLHIINSENNTQHTMLLSTSSLILMPSSLVRNHILQTSPLIHRGIHRIRPPLTQTHFLARALSILSPKNIVPQKKKKKFNQLFHILPIFSQISIYVSYILSLFLLQFHYIITSS